MNTSSEPAHDHQLAGAPTVGFGATTLDSQKPLTVPLEIKVGKHTALVGGKEIEVFTMAMGTETIELLPLRNWGQLDIYKWRVRGKLPGTPAGLEITFDHVKLLGETVRLKDGDGCAKLEKLFAEWLTVERESLELARRKAQAKPAPVSADATVAAGQQPIHFEVEVDNKGMVHVRCLQGKETVATIGLNTAGFHSLVSQGFMRKPHAIKAGALHDWVELDGVLFSFEKGNNDAAKLQEALNRSYLPSSNQGQGKAVVIYANSASSTGFDIQFPAKAGGLTENRRRPLTEEALDLLQDPDHCGLLHGGIVIKLTRPTLIFKKKTPDGGERYLEQSRANTVRVVDEDGVEALIDLSHPVNYLHLSAVELTAVFNHPSINRHTQAAAPAPSPASSVPASVVKQQPPAVQAASAPREAPSQAGHVAVQTPTQPPRATAGGVNESAAEVPRTSGTGTSPEPNRVPEVKSTQTAEPPRKPDSSKPEPLPNSWLKPVLEQQSIRFDWLTCLVYGRIARWLGNSREGELSDRKCWLVELNETEPSGDLTSGRSSNAIFLTSEGGFGFLSGNSSCLFEKTRATIGSKESSLIAEPVHLLGAGLDASDRFVFIVGDGYRARLPEDWLSAALAQLKKSGAVVLSVQEAVESKEPLQVVWTVPVEQADPADPQAVESTPPEPRPSAVI